MAHTKKIMKHFILDVDGVLTDGKIYTTPEGKFLKVFGSDDSDALILIKPYINIFMVTGDKKGFEITKRRVETEMKYPLHQVSTFERLDWIKAQGYNPDECIYMGDGIFDHLVFKGVGYGIAPANSFDMTLKKADFITKRRGGEGAVAEAAMHIMEKFFEPIDWDNFKMHDGEWGKKK